MVPYLCWSLNLPYQRRKDNKNGKNAVRTLLPTLTPHCQLAHCFWALWLSILSPEGYAALRSLSNNCKLRDWEQFRTFAEIKCFGNLMISTAIFQMMYHFWHSVCHKMLRSWKGVCLFQKIFSGLFPVFVASYREFKMSIVFESSSCLSTLQNCYTSKCITEDLKLQYRVTWKTVRFTKLLVKDMCKEKSN